MEECGGPKATQTLGTVHGLSASQIWQHPRETFGRGGSFSISDVGKEVLHLRVSIFGVCGEVLAAGYLPCVWPSVLNFAMREHMIYFVVPWSIPIFPQAGRPSSFLGFLVPKLPYPLNL